MHTRQIESVSGQVHCLCRIIPKSEYYKLTHSEELEVLTASEIQNADLEVTTAGSNRGNDAKPQNRLRKTRYTQSDLYTRIFLPFIWPY